MAAALPAQAPENPGTRWVGSGQAGRRAGAAVRSLLPHQPTERLSPDSDTGLVPGSDPDRRSGQDIEAGLDPHSDPVPHYRAGESVHSAHRAAVLPDPSPLVDRSGVGVCCAVCCADATKAGASTMLALSAPESTHCKRFLLFKSILKPPCPGDTPDRSARTYCIDGNAHSPSLFLTLFYGKSYPGISPRQLFLPPGNAARCLRLDLVDSLDIHLPFADYSHSVQLVIESVLHHVWSNDQP